jgi:ribosome-binding protein aMBF1 (putative translation factor)
MILKTMLVSGVITMAGTFIYQPVTIVDDEIPSIRSNHRENYKQIGNQIRIVRLSKQISCEALANALDLEEENLQAIEDGKTIPVKDIIFKAEDILETTFLSEN